MQCLHCGTALASLRGATHGSYCSVDHLLEHAGSNLSADYLFLLDPPDPVACKAAHSASGPAPVMPRVAALLPKFETGCAEASFHFDEAGLLPWSPFPVAREPAQRAQRIAPKLVPARPAVVQPQLIPYTPCLQPDPPPALLTRLTAFAFQHWKLSLALVPLAFVAFIQSSPSWTSSIQRQSVHSASVPMLSSFRNTFRRRAAVQFSDDFRSGLDDWASNKNLATSWTYDEAGFVRPSALAVYRPTMDLEDYTIEFLGQIEQKGLGLAFRVVDWNHYYAVKLMTVNTGPVPVLELVRYAVEGNREVSRVTRRFPSSFHDTSLCRLRLDVHGNDFTLINQGQIVDDWTDDRYPKGGIGFFCGKGERARLRWVQVSHQNDAIGRFCALLAPNDGQNRNGNWNQP